MTSIFLISFIAHYLKENFRYIIQYLFIGSICRGTDSLIYLYILLLIFLSSAPKPFFELSLTTRIGDKNVVNEVR